MAFLADSNKAEHDHHNFTTDKLFACKGIHLTRYNINFASAITLHIHSDVYISGKALFLRIKQKPFDCRVLQTPLWTVCTCKAGNDLFQNSKGIYCIGYA